MPVTGRNESASGAWLNLVPALQQRYGEAVVAALRRETERSVALEALLSKECRSIEMHEGGYAAESRIPVPEPVQRRLARYRPTPLVRADRWEQVLGFEGEIWVKREDLTPSGSHKMNTAIPQSYYAQTQGLQGIVADTGAGQWGLALAMACQDVGLRCVVFMPGHSYERKQYRRLLMQATGAEVFRSPSSVTKAGRSVRGISEDAGRLSQAMSEAYEFAALNDDFCLGQGCLSFYAPLHQSVIGLESWQSLATAGVTPDVLVACAGGGTNLLGFMAPWIERALQGADQGPRMIAVEAAEVPALTKGKYRYDSPDACGVGADLLMFTVGAGTAMPDIDAAGLRYHAKSPLLSLLVHEQVVEASAVTQNEARRAGIEFFRAEDVLPAPESAHALAAVRQLVEAASAEGRRPKIVVCLSGCGQLDAPFYAG